MSEVTLKPKIQLKVKGAAAPFTFDEKLQIEMVWNSETDLDLCLFWKTKDVNAFGAYTPSLGTGLYHTAESEIAGGIKLWSYGTDRDTIWSVLSTAKKQTYAEIQGGPIGDQSIKLEMKPDETRWHTEYWIPSDRELSLYSLKVPAEKIRPVQNVPLFSWSRNKDVDIWLQLKNAFSLSQAPPAAPLFTENCWAPSGMEDLDEAFRWVVETTSGDESERWRFYYGTWLAGRDRSDEAIKVLSGSNTGLSKVVLARLLSIAAMSIGFNAFCKTAEKFISFLSAMVFSHAGMVNVFLIALLS